MNNNRQFKLKINIPMCEIVDDRRGSGVQYVHVVSIVRLLMTEVAVVCSMSLLMTVGAVVCLVVGIPPISQMVLHLTVQFSFQ